jgi:hypothetical protein
LGRAREERVYRATIHICLLGTGLRGLAHVLPPGDLDRVFWFILPSLTVSTSFALRSGNRCEWQFLEVVCDLPISFLPTTMTEIPRWCLLLSFFFFFFSRICFFVPYNIDYFPECTAWIFDGHFSCAAPFIEPVLCDEEGVLHDNVTRLCSCASLLIPSPFVRACAINYCDI